MNTRPRAFTLLEVVITIGIFLIMFIALVNFFVSSNSTFNYDKSYVDTASGAETVMTAVSASVLPADQVVASHAFSTGTQTTSTTTLVLELPAVDSTGAIVSGAYDYVAFYQAGSSAYERIEANAGSARKTATKLLTDKLSSLTFSYDASDMTLVTRVTVDVQTQATAKESTLSNHLTKQLRLRNTL